MITQLPRYCSASNKFVSFNVPDFHVIICNSVYKFTVRIHTNHNSFIVCHSEKRHEAAVTDEEPLGVYFVCSLP